MADEMKEAVSRPLQPYEHRWLGRVDRVKRKTFDATMYRVDGLDDDDELHPTDFATFRIASVAEAERGLLVPGATFDFSVRIDELGQGKTTLVMKEPHRWTQAELDEAKRRADEMIAALGWLDEADADGTDEAVPRDEDET